MEVDRAKLSLRRRSTFRGDWSAPLREVRLELLRERLSADCAPLGVRRGDLGLKSALSEPGGRRPPRRLGDLGWPLPSMETERWGCRMGESTRNAVASIQETDRFALLRCDRSRDRVASLQDADRLYVRVGEVEDVDRFKDVEEPDRFKDVEELDRLGLGLRFCDCGVPGVPDGGGGGGERS